MKTGVTKMMMTMTTGKTKTDTSLKDLYEAQMQNQMLMLSKGMYEGKAVQEILPVDDVSLSSYHVQQLVSEIGEVLDADKRWKNFRNEKYDKEAKAEEIADCFIVLLNIAMFSGIDSDRLENSIREKIHKVHERVVKA